MEEVVKTILPYLPMTIESKEDSYGKLIYTAKPPKGQERKMKYAIGYFPTEEEAVAAYEKAYTG